MDLRQAIEQVTDPSQTIEDWATMMKICDDVAIHSQRYINILFDMK